MKKIFVLSVALAFTMMSAPLIVMADDSTHSQLPPQLQAIGVKQATASDMAEVRGENVPYHVFAAAAMAFRWAVSYANNPTAQQVKNEVQSWFMSLGRPLYENYLIKNHGLPAYDQLKNFG